jgi:hypothetical protein
MAKEVKIDINVGGNLNDTAKTVDDINKGLKDVNETAEDVNETLNDTSDGVKKVGKATEGAESGLKKVGKGVKGIGLAFKAAGIGLIIAGFTLLKEVFMKNQKVADALSTAFETISIVFNEVTKSLTDTYESVSQATGGFDALGKVVGGVLTIAITPLKLAFFGIKLGIQEAQLIWEKSFFGDNDLTTIHELNKSIKETQDELREVGNEAIEAGKDIGENIVEAVTEVSSFVVEAGNSIGKISIKAANEQAKLTVELKNRAQIAEAQQGVLIEQYDRAAEKLRQVRDEERNSIDSRIEANNELSKVLEKEEKALLRQADLQIQSAQNDVNKNNNIENRVALLTAQANREGVLSQIEGLRSEQLANDLALSKEKIQLTQSLIDSQTQLTLDEKRFNAERIEDETLRLEALRIIVEEEKIIELERLQAKIDGYNVDTQARVDAEIEYATRKQELDQEIIKIEDDQRADKLAKEKEAAKQSKALEVNKTKVAYGTLSTISNLVSLFAGKSEKDQKRAFDIQKAAGIARAGIDTFTAAMGAAKDTVGGPIIKGLAAAAVITGGLLNIKKIASQKFQGGGDKSPSPIPTAPTMPETGRDSSEPLTPSFDLFGSANQGNNAGGTTSVEGGGQNITVKAIVVESDVTGAQNKINKIEDSSTL